MSLALLVLLLFESLWLSNSFIAISNIYKKIETRTIKIPASKNENIIGSVVQYVQQKVATYNKTTIASGDENAVPIKYVRFSDDNSFVGAQSIGNTYNNKFERQVDLRIDSDINTNNIINNNSIKSSSRLSVLLKRFKGIFSDKSNQVNDLTPKKYPLSTTYYQNINIDTFDDIKKSPFGIKKFLRRRILNIFYRDRGNWARGLSSESEDGSGLKVLVSTPELKAIIPKSNNRKRDRLFGNIRNTRDRILSLSNNLVTKAREIITTNVSKNIITSTNSKSNSLNSSTIELSSPSSTTSMSLLSSLTTKTNLNNSQSTKINDIILRSVINTGAGIAKRLLTQFRNNNRSLGSSDDNQPTYLDLNSDIPSNSISYEVIPSNSINNEVLESNSEHGNNSVPISSLLSNIFPISSQIFNIFKNTSSKLLKKNEIDVQYQETVVLNNPVNTRLKSSGTSIISFLRKYSPLLKFIKIDDRNIENIDSVTLNYSINDAIATSISNLPTYLPKVSLSWEQYIKSNVNTYLNDSNFSFETYSNSSMNSLSSMYNWLGNLSPKDMLLTSFQNNSNSINILDSINVKMNGNDVFLKSSKVDQAYISNKLPSYNAPTNDDFAYIDMILLNSAITSSNNINNIVEAKTFLREITLKPLLTALAQKSPYLTSVVRVNALKGILQLLSYESDLFIMNQSVAAQIISSDTIKILVELIETPSKWLKFKSLSALEIEKEEQYLSICIFHSLIRSSDKAGDVLREDIKLKRVLNTIIAMEEANNNKNITSNTIDISKSLTERKKFANTTVVTECKGLSSVQMARVIMWGIGGNIWKPKQSGQKGLRILSFDGGGTRGVLSIALLKEVLRRANKSNPYEIFDIICGTSTGGILAALLGTERTSVEEAERLYDSLIDKVFGRKSNFKLVSSQAFYDENEFESVLYSIVGDEILIDSRSDDDTTSTFFVSTKVNTIPQAQIWRNYNYPSGQNPRYPGSYRVNTLTTIRATTAAPTFFTPVQWDGGLYCDGALVANNPTAIALQEAKSLHPGIPIELVVSIGTGIYNQTNNVQSMGWDTLVTQLVASATETEDVHNVLKDFLPNDKYFRFNPILPTNLAIDEKDKSRLNILKELALKTVEEVEKRDKKSFDNLIKLLKGNK